MLIQSGVYVGIAILNFLNGVSKNYRDQNFIV